MTKLSKTKMKLKRPMHEMEQCVFFIRGNRVILDCDLARFYELKTFNLKKATTRNSERFPNDFMFQLTPKERDSLKFEGRSKGNGRGDRRPLPYCFTQEGVSMLSSILNNRRAIEISIDLLRTFVRLRNTQNVLSNRAKKTESVAGDELKHRPKQISDTKGAPKKGPLYTSELILKAVAQHYSLAPKDLKIVTRLKSIALPRQIAIYLIRKQTRICFRDIGKLFDGKDHSTVLHAYRKIDTALGKDDSIHEAVISIQRIFLKLSEVPSFEESVDSSLSR